MILHTILVRPYVFVFLIAFLVIGILNRGLRKTLFFLFSGYLIAWASEASSIRTGFPYGWYFYRYENLQGEWLNFGVPVWDSLSYTFLCFSGMSLAEFILKIQTNRTSFFKKSSFSTLFKLALLSAFFVTLLDVIVDPLAHRGAEWFLGDIYFYPFPGHYFNVPMSNFAGWFLVSFLIVSVNVWFERTVGTGFTIRSAHGTWGARTLIRKPAPTWTAWIARYGGIGLYFGVFVFNFLITLWIEAYLMATMALFWISIPAFAFIYSLKAKRFSP